MRSRTGCPTICGIGLVSLHPGWLIVTALTCLVLKGIELGKGEREAGWTTY